MLKEIYKNLVIKNAKIILSFLTITLLIFIYFAKDFRLDSSSDALLLENDKDLKLLREVNKRYSSKDFLVLTYTPKNKITEISTIINLSNLRKDLIKLDWVDSVVSILDVPLFKNSDEPITQRIKNYKTLKDEGVDINKGYNEIINNSIYKNFIISKDGKTTGIIVYIKNDREILDLIEQKNIYLNKIQENKLTSSDKKNYKRFLKKYDDYKNLYNKKNHQNILQIRKIIKNYSNSAEIYLGGIPMIADDMMSFIKNDIIVFGAGVFFFIVLTLWYIFKNLVWVLMPLLSCFFSVFIMVGLLGLLGWKVTVISSNFIALMLILTMAMNIHVCVRFLQFKNENKKIKNNKAILWTTQKMFWPVLYTVLTTVCAFLSLIFSNIKPIINFGWMMTVGLTISLFITFTLLPAMLNVFVKKKKIIKQKKLKFTSLLGEIAKKNTKSILTIFFITIMVSIYGISKLEVENSFINYFDEKTEIYKGMKLIDEKLGGTTPLNVILKFPKKKVVKTDDDFESWDDDSPNDNAKYWFTRSKIDKIGEVHDYLDSLPEVGKVLSFASIIRVAEDLNNNKKLDSLEMGVLYSKIPEEIKNEIVNPYISIDNNEARITLRIKDSLKNLKRNDLINKINLELKNKLNLKENEFKISGVLILFNNLLQSLFKSQILTLGVVMAGITIMFLILFRNIKLSLIGVMPNFLAAFFILGIIGLLKIPLDMMTITIAAITIGIAVDNSIHYIYRFKEEFKKIKNYNKTLDKCHSTVGVAIFNTSITIIFGFSILVLSNFIPTIYFGLFTGLAMFLALISVLTLMPKLILIFRPF